MLATGVFPLGDSAVFVQFGDRIEEEVHERVRHFCRLLDARPPAGMVEYVPGFTSVTVYYDPRKVDCPADEPPYRRMCASLEALAHEVSQGGQDPGRLVEIPVCYGEEFGPDLAYVADYHGLSPERVVEIHSGTEYRVYMIGFAPGFPYLGGLSPELATPRKTSPRLTIPAGSVGIAGNQTGVYSVSTPGGWQIIGRTPLVLFRPDLHPPSLLRAGDRVRFYPISREEFNRWNGQESRSFTRDY